MLLIFISRIHARKIENFLQKIRIAIIVCDASQLEVAMYRRKTGSEVPDDMFLYCAIKCDASSYQIRYMIAERTGAIDDKESLGRIFFEGRVNG
jgi:hypothetical protein